MVLVLDGNQVRNRCARKEHSYQIQSSHRSEFFFLLKTYFIHACATCFELPSNSFFFIKYGYFSSCVRKSSELPSFINAEVYAVKQIVKCGRKGAKEQISRTVGQKTLGAVSGSLVKDCIVICSFVLFFLKITKLIIFFNIKYL